MTTAAANLRPQKSDKNTAAIKRGEGGRFDRGWTTAELQALRRLALLGAETVAEELGRSVWSVRNQARRLRISLRRTGEERGRIMGQPRGVKLRLAAQRIRGLRTLRADVLSGRVDLARAERRARLLARRGTDCPACGVRPQEVESSGLCTDCHLEGLARGHALNAGTVEAQRALDRERQRKHRGDVQSADTFGPWARAIGAGEDLPPEDLPPDQEGDD